MQYPHIRSSTALWNQEIFDMKMLSTFGKCEPIYQIWGKSRQMFLRYEPIFSSSFAHFQKLQKMQTQIPIALNFGTQKNN